MAESFTVPPKTYKSLLELVRERRTEVHQRESIITPQRPPSTLRAFLCQPQADIQGISCHNGSGSGSPGTVSVASADAWLLYLDPNTGTYKYEKNQNGDRVTRKVYNSSSRKIEGSTDNIEEGGTFTIAHAVEEYLRHDLFIVRTQRITCGSGSGSGSEGSEGSQGSGSGEPAECIPGIDGVPWTDVPIAESMNDVKHVLGVDHRDCLIRIPWVLCPPGSGSGSGS